MKSIIVFEDTGRNDNQLYTVSEVEKSKELQTVDSGLAIYQEKSKALQVANQTDYDAAGDFCANIKEAYKRIETKRKFFGKPYADAKKAIDAMFKDKTTALAKIEQDTKSKMLAWHTAEKARVDAENERIAKENADKLKSSQDDIMPPVMMPSKTEVAQTARTGNSTSTVRMIKKWRITDFNQIPREFLCVDDKKVTAAVKAGLQVPGVEQYEEPSLAVR